MYRRLQEWALPCSDFVAVDHLNPDDEALFIEKDDHIIHQGQLIKKPFVEKPFDADRHDIWIYYPRNLGGGCKQLFRKVADNALWRKAELHCGARRQESDESPA